PHLQVSDLPRALRWAEEVGFADTGVWFGADLPQKLLLFAWEHLDAPGVLEHFAPALLARIRGLDFYGPTRDASDRLVMQIEADPAKRRVVLSHLLTLGISDVDLRHLSATRPRLADNSDFEWLLEQLRRET